MKKLEKLIISLSIIILLILIILCAMYIKELSNKPGEWREDLTGEGTTLVEDISLDIVKEKEEYLRIKKCLEQYINELNIDSSIYYGYDDNNNYTNITDEKTINTRIYNVLSEIYIKNNSITVENIREHIYKIKEDCFYIPITIDMKAKSQNVKTYGIYGVIGTLNYNPIMESYLLLNIDESNNTFSVQQLKDENDLNTITVEKINNIEVKENNRYVEEGIINENIIKDYILTYKRLALTYPDIVYQNYLDSNYKQMRFGTAEKYKEFIEENRDTIKRINIGKYELEEQEGYTQYIGIDQNNKYYIFNVNSVNDYKIILDNYTIDLPQFLEKYNKASQIQKVGYNIQKCIEAINNKDYSYVYSKLDETFKKKNYNTKESFEKYIKDNLFDNNVVSKDITTTQEGDIYIYNITINNEDNNEKKEMTIIMKLLEGTDFVMSFNIK